MFKIPLHKLRLACCSEDPDVKGTETDETEELDEENIRCSEDPDVKGTETAYFALIVALVL